MMSTHWSDAYIGQPYISGERDCGNLAARVRLEVFGDASALQVAELQRAAGQLGKQRQVEQMLSAHGHRTEQPMEGDAVVMQNTAGRWHVGSYCLIDGEAWVLHNMKNAKQVVRHRLRELARVGLSVEGFYQWKH